MVTITDYHSVEGNCISPTRTEHSLKGIKEIILFNSYKPVSCGFMVVGLTYLNKNNTERVHLLQ